jgi:hypothetical protein
MQRRVKHDHGGGGPPHSKGDADQEQVATKPGRKLVFDADNRSCRVWDLTIDEARAVAADINARMAALQRQWEASGDLQALLGGLIFCQQQMPAWVFKGLMENIQQQLNNPDATRFLLVRYAHDQLGLTIDESYDWASSNVTDPTARGGRDTMMRGYQRVRRLVADIDRIRPRPPSPRRR